MPISLYFFHKIKKIGMNCRDARGSTPLHWACFSSSELALIYILAWIEPSDLKLQDIDGYTALHLAVKSTEELESCRPIRALLFRGAPKDIEDKAGNTPLDLTQRIESLTLRDELVGYLTAKGGMLDCCMLKTPLKKVEKSYKMPALFFSLNGSVFLILGLFLFPVWQNRQLIWLNIALGVAAFLMWAITAKTKPGYIKKPKNIEFLKLMQLIDPV